MANLKAMDSDWFAQTYMGRKSKVGVCVLTAQTRGCEKVLIDCPIGCAFKAQEGLIHELSPLCP